MAEEDIALNLEICDQIRSKSVPPKDATRALKRRINHQNPNVQLLALGVCTHHFLMNNLFDEWPEQLTDVCVKNGGDHFLIEVASKEFMDNLVAFTLKSHPGNVDVRNKALQLIQNWAVTFEGKYTLGYVGQVYKDLKSEGALRSSRKHRQPQVVILSRLQLPPKRPNCGPFCNDRYVNGAGLDRLGSLHALPYQFHDDKPQTSLP